MKVVERVVMVMLVLVLVGGSGWLYVAYKHDRQSLKEAVAQGEYQIPLTDNVPEESTSDWRTYYPELIPVVIGTVTVQASVADSLPERIKGLSNTPFLPEGAVKLFAFGAEGEHGIWMKDMRYPLDILWVAKNGTIVHIEEDVSPGTYPESFSSPKPAWYVIEANAGFVARSSIAIGDVVQVPTLHTE